MRASNITRKHVRFILSLDGVSAARSTPGKQVAFMQAASAEARILEKQPGIIISRQTTKVPRSSMWRRSRSLCKHLPETGRLRRAGAAKTKRGKSLLPPTIMAGRSGMIHVKQKCRHGIPAEATHFDDVTGWTEQQVVTRRSYAV